MGTDGHVRTVQHGDRSVVQLAGDVDVYTAASLREELVRLLDADRSDVLVDLTDVTFLDSTALGVLVEVRKHITARGGRLELAVADERVLKVLRIAGLSRAFVIHPSVRAALAGDA